MKTNSYIISSALTALLLYLLLSFSLGKIKDIAFNPSDFPYMSWTAWTINDFLKQKEKPQIVFLGSSLMLVPLAGTDANAFQKFFDGSEHHRSLYFENQFNKANNSHIKTFNFALPGEMPSDAFLATKFFLKEEKTPDLIIWGVGPRDFLDNLLPSPASTDPFRFLSRFGSVEQYLKVLMPDFFSQMDYFWNKYDYLYGKRANISLVANNYLSRQISDLVPLAADTHPISIDERRFLMPSYGQFELRKKDAFFRPSKDEKTTFVDNIAEYRKRYKNLKWETYLTQMEFFSRTLSEARQRNIHVLIIAMPITDINKSLLSQSSWRLYKRSINLITKLKGASLIDLSETNAFCLNDFCDTIHLNATGGKKLLDIIIDRTTNDQKIASVLNVSPLRKNTKIAQTSKQPL